MASNGNEECPDCSREFVFHRNSAFNENCLRQHLQVHMPRVVPCPFNCGKSFKSQANAVFHFEAGGCSFCPDKDKARRLIYSLIHSNNSAEQFLLDPSKVRYFGGTAEKNPKDVYECHWCRRGFRLFSSFMQHAVSIREP